MSDGPAAAVELRRRILERRRALPADQVAELSRMITERFLGISRSGFADWRGLNVALYRALPDEFDERGLERELFDRGAALHFPRIVDSSAKTMEMAKVRSRDALRQEVEWSVGPYGIHEPALAYRATPPEELDLVLVPGVVFGEEGERIGMGGGFYDRYLPRATKALRVALAFDFQVLPSLAQQAWDQPVHWIVTESREILADWKNGKKAT